MDLVLAVYVAALQDMTIFEPWRGMHILCPGWISDMQQREKHGWEHEEHEGQEGRKEGKKERDGEEGQQDSRKERKKRKEGTRPTVRTG